MLFVFVEFSEVLGGLGDYALEIFTGPLDGVFDLVGEVFQGAERDGLFWGIDDIVVALSVMGDNNLRMALGSKGSTFKQRLLIPNNLIINILPSLNIINSTDNQIQIIPKIVVEIILIFRRNFKFQSIKSTFLVNFLTDFAGGLAFVAAYVFSSEQELTVEVADLDVVVVCADYFAFAVGSDAHQCEHFY